MRLSEKSKEEMNHFIHSALEQGAYFFDHADIYGGGMSETVFHRGDIVTECAHSNVSVLKDGIFYSHPNDELILRGIAKTHMLQACYRLGITVMEKPFTVDFLRDADEIIVTSSSNFCLHACEFEGKPAGGKDPATLKAIQDEVLKEFYDYTGCESLWG